MASVNNDIYANHFPSAIFLYHTCFFIVFIFFFDDYKNN